VTGAPLEAPPPSDTLERLPDDFWGSATASAEATEAPAHPAPADVDTTEVAAHTAPDRAPADTPRDAVAEPVAPSEPPSRRPSGAGVATLQRLFPGRVLGVEPPAGGDGVAVDAIDTGDDHAVVATPADDATDEAPDEGGLESDRSRR
jgi:hypothetical protein